MSEIITFGLDLAKRVFQVHGADAIGHWVLRKKLSCDKVLPFFHMLSANQAPRPPRRKRVSGRTIQFNVKLTQETIDFIYEVANSRNIPLAQVMEEFVEAFKTTSR